MKTLGWLMVAGVALVASLAVACGGDADSDAEQSSGPQPSLGGGMIAQNVHMTYGGQQYVLVNMMFESMVDESEFQAIGEATESDVDMKGDMRVYSRRGDSTAVFTHSAATADDQGLWLAWRLTS